MFFRPSQTLTAPRPTRSIGPTLACVLLLAACTPSGDDPATTAATSATAVPEGSPRHVLFLTVDTLRAERMSLYGAERATTPFLERFADDARVYEQAIVQWPKTGTSFASMFVGRFPQSTGLTHKAAVRIPGDLPVLPEQFQQAGFRTLAVVSNAVLSKELGWDRGFDEYVETWADDPTEDPVEYRKLLHAQRVNRLAVEMLERNGYGKGDLPQERLFLWVHYSDPHAPYILPAESDNPFLDDAEFNAAEAQQVDLAGTAGKAIGDATDLRFYRAQYDANVLEVDMALEGLIEELKGRQLFDDAFTVITSDHGESLGEHELYFEHGPLPYNTASWVPLLLHGAGTEPGRVADPVELVGLVPTLRSRLGELDWPDDAILEGAAWTDPAPQLEEAALAFAEAGRAGQRYFRSVQDGRWKLIHRAPRKARRQKPEDYELYDLVADPLETRNVRDEHPAEVRRLRDALLDWVGRTALAGAGGGEGDTGEGDDAAARALKAMGYIGN